MLFHWFAQEVFACKSVCTVKDIIDDGHHYQGVVNGSLVQLDSVVFAAVTMNFCCVDSLKQEVRISEPVTEHSHEQGYKQKQGILYQHIAFSPFLLTVPAQDTHQFRIALSIVKGNE